ncbi:hypothetical protein M9H77_04991 [Catharanthus roseus]|uniref:Uncharacterized protein n=1 Tax=Catharanthus roseus TaxID=4058 RepID=A0ACC0CG19_CATRO|nr:hypothetical protein M9H77_04991 [Catharanthus roseus]
MEEVLAHVHPGPIVSDVLSRQHKHRSGLIWSGDRETCYTDLKCRRFGRNLFQCYSAAPLVHRSFGGCMTDWKGFGVSSDMGVVAYTYIAALADEGDYGRPSCSSWCNMVLSI